MIPITPAMASSAVSTAELLINAALLMYKEMTKPQPLKGQDKKDYLTLKLLYETKLEKNIPKEWALQDDCPIYMSTFSENIQFLKTELSQLESSTYQQKSEVGGMVAHIESLFALLNDKKDSYLKYISEKTKEVIFQYADYRPDGYEAMFFSELAIWLCISLPRESIYDVNTAKIILDRINYCSEMQKVLTYRNDDKIANNPKTILSYIILNLETLHVSVSESCKAASFNTKIQAVNASILGMSKSVFDLFHHLLDKSSPDYQIQINVLLDEYENSSRQGNVVQKEPNAQVVIEHLMGRWIIETLQKSGINSNNFKNKKPIDPHNIPFHLDEDISRISLEKTGLSNFPQCQLKNDKSSVKRNRIANYLKHIAEIHRLLLMIYYVRESIVMGSEVSKDLGNAWVYGENTGKGIALVLCMVILDSCSRLSQKIQQFWKIFYVNDFVNERLIPNAVKQKTNLYCKKLQNADTVVSRIKKYHEDIKKKLDEIRVEILSYAPKDMVDKIRTLKQHLSTYVGIYNLELDNELREEIDRLSTSLHDGRFEKTYRYIEIDGQLERQEDLVMEHEQKELPFYFAVKNILDNRTQSPGDLMPEPSRLSMIQRTIYREYLTLNRGLANLGSARYLSGLWGVYPWRVDYLIETYFCIQAVFQLLYSRSDRMKAGLTGEPTPVEWTLIDLLLNEKIREDFKRWDYYSFNGLLPSPPLEVITSETKIKLRFTGEWFNAIKDDLLYKYVEQLIAKLDEKEIIIEELMKERQAMEEKLNKNIQELKNTIEAQKIEISTHTARNEELMKQVSEKEQQLPEISHTLQQYENENHELRQRFSDAIPNLNHGVAFFPKKYFPKFTVVLISMLPGEIDGQDLDDRATLIKQEEEYYFYGKTNAGTWGLTVLEKNKIQPLGLEFPDLGKKRELFYESHGKKNKALKPLYEHIFDKKAHIVEGTGLFSRFSISKN